LDCELAVADLAGYFPGGVDHELLAGGQVALEAPVDLRDVDAHRAGEHTLLRDLDDAAVHRRLDPAFDHQRVAVGDLRSLQLDVGTYDQLAALGFTRTHR